MQVPDRLLASPALIGNSICSSFNWLLDARRFSFSAICFAAKQVHWKRGSNELVEKSQVTRGCFSHRLTLWACPTILSLSLVGTVLFPFVGLLVYLFPIGVVSFELLALLGGDDL